MPLFVPRSLLPARALAFSFLTIASAFSLANDTNIMHNFRSPACYPVSGSPRIVPLSERDCLLALGEFQRDLPFGVTPILTHDPDKAHLPQYILAPAIATYGECTFRAGIPPGNDARIDVEALVYQAYVLMAKCVGKADYDGGRSRAEAKGARTWINIEFRYYTPTTVTNFGVGSITNDSGLDLSSSTAKALLSLSAIPSNVVAASR